MVISGDIKWPDISCHSVDSASGANELPFIEALHDHFLTQINNTPTRGSNILDIVGTSAPEHTKVTEVLSPDKAGAFTDLCVVIIYFVMAHNRRKIDCRESFTQTFKIAIFVVVDKFARV